MIEDITHDVNGVELSFNGNPQLKPCNCVINYSKEHVEEFVKCSQDWQYFVENYHHTITLDSGLCKIKLRDYQVDLINSFINNKFTLALASRQSGKSESYICFVLWTILFQKDKFIGILANKEATTLEMLRKIKQSYELVPMFLKQGTITWNVKSIRLENGCSIFAGSTSSSSIRGRSLNILILDEMAHIPTGQWTAFYESTYPTISSSKTSKVIIVSTPLGMNHFYKFWEDAINKRNEFTPVRVDWWQVPGRDEKWKEETIANTSLISFAQEFGNSFTGSIATLIDPEFVRTLKYIPGLPHPKIFNQIPEQHQKFLKIYEEPIRGHVYSIGVDSCKMTEENTGDALGMQVIDITSFPFKQVATFFAKEGFNYLFAPEIAVKLGMWYNGAYMFVENNEIGQEVANIIHFDYEYENTFFEKNDTVGFRTTKRTKRLGCTNLKMLVESGKLILNDFDTISQLSTFIRVKDSYKAENGYLDDLIMALIASIFFMLSKSLDISDIEDTQKLISTIRNEVVLDDEDLPGFGVLPDDDYESEQKADAEGFTW